MQCAFKVRCGVTAEAVEGIKKCGVKERKKADKRAAEGEIWGGGVKM